MIGYAMFAPCMVDYMVSADWTTRLWTSANQRRTLIDIFRGDIGSRD